MTEEYSDFLLYLPTQTRQALLRAGIRGFEQLQAKADVELMRLDNIGKMGLRRIEMGLRERGRSLAGVSEPPPSDQLLGVLRDIAGSLKRLADRPS